MGGHPKLFVLIGVQSAVKKTKQMLEGSVQVFKRKGRGGNAREEHTIQVRVNSAEKEKEKYIYTYIVKKNITTQQRINQKVKKNITKQVRINQKVNKNIIK